MEIKRNIEQSLDVWKKSPYRKPLILRGARQVGKTTVVKKFSTSYPYTIILNLEKPSDLRFFQEHTEINTIIEALFLSKNIPLEAMKDTLLFIDEIQESPKAIQWLRYFYEEFPALHVIAAGSLLEFAMRNVQSFPVGRIEYLYVHPLTFIEYLQAMGKSELLKKMQEVPIAAVAHTLLLEAFHQYIIIGGMPEVVSVFLKEGSMTALPSVYESIWATYQNDVEKYTSTSTERNVIKHIVTVAHLYLEQRVKFQNFGNSNYRSREVGEAFRNLDAAKIIQLIYPTTVIDPPIQPDLKKSPRLQFLDTGLVNHALRIQADLLSLNDMSSAYKGAILPHMITQELISLQEQQYTKPNFWVREKKQSSSEVDLVIAHQDKVIPIEIKSGSTGSLRSLHQFVERAPHPYAIRIYGGVFNIEQAVTPNGVPYLLMNLPYYLGTKIYEYIDFFVNNYTTTH